MLLTERHTIHKGDARFTILDTEAFRSKNLYNATMYAVRQHFFDTGKYLPYASLQKEFQESGQSDYRALPSKVAQWTMKMVDQNFRSFFKALKAYGKNPEKFEGRPRIPKYLHKTDGRYLLTYTKQAIGKRECEKHGVITMSGTGVSVKSAIPYDSIRQVRVFKRLDRYVVEVVYEKEDVSLVKDNGRYCAIDLGVSNFATVTSNINGFRPYVISGRVLKSYNRWWNKEVSRAKAILATRNGGKKTSRRIRRMTEKRNNKVRDFMHKASRIVANQLASEGVSTVYVGRNTGWKQDVGIGRVNNQNFVGIPYEMFISYLKYKCRMMGIAVEVVEESYTSKCSFLDTEELCKHEVYMGRRVKRGLFRSKDGRLINADVNGSYNILRKGKPEAFDADGVEGVLAHPTVIKTVE